jgi:predicted dienelactone hydrolase
MMTQERSDMFVGSCDIAVRDSTSGVEFPVVVMYPTRSEPVPTHFGPYVMNVAPNAAPAPGRYPLAVISHGGGGWHLLYRELSTSLAANGFVVAMLEHHGNNRNDNHLADTYENLVNRPRHVSLTIDAVAADVMLAPHVDASAAAVIGHSLGGYTVLSLAGGVPWTREARRVDVASDPRVRALVLFAPAVGWFGAEDSLRHVSVPILLLVGEHDVVTPASDARIILNGVPDPSRVEFRVVENAGHFSFLSPFPPSMQRPGFVPASDPDGFDRVRFHEELPEEVLRFLTRALP